MSNGDPDPITVLIGIVLSIIFFVIALILDLVRGETIVDYLLGMAGIAVGGFLLAKDLRHRRHAGQWPFADYSH